MNLANIDSAAADLARVLEESKALSPVILPLSGENAIADALVIATATSRRHARALAQEAADWCKNNGRKTLHLEGFETGEWILVDANDLIIHIFLPEIRDLYRLVELASEIPAKEPIK